MILTVASGDTPVGRNETVPKILIITGDAAESLEVMYPYQRLLEEGYEVDIAAPSKKKLQFVVHDFVDGYDTYTEKAGYTWPADVAFADVNPADYVALVIPGGRAPEYIRNDKDVQRIVRHFMGADMPVAQLCHAPQVLAAAGTLQGRRTAAYPALAPDVTVAGAEFVDGAAVVDGQMVSARAWPDHPAWMREFIHILRAKAPA
jgi:protease I